MGFKKCNEKGLKRVLNRPAVIENFAFNENLDNINIAGLGFISHKITIKEPQKK